MPRAAAKKKPFATEAELCARFISYLPKGWTPYAETAGWDILLVRGADGLQIGIEAKLRLNAQVFAQAIESGYWYQADGYGPDLRAVMVPMGDAGHWREIAGYLGITIIQVYSENKYGAGFHPLLPHKEPTSDWHECIPAKRHKLPAYVPDVAAGASAPVQLTEWKIKAIKIAVTVERRGYVTRKDFKHIGIDYRRWIVPAYGWLDVANGVYIAGHRLGDFKVQHPRVYAEIAAKYDDWYCPDPGVTLTLQPTLV